MVLCELGPLLHHRQQICPLRLEDIVKDWKGIRSSRRLQNIIQFHYVSMSSHFPQNLDFPEQSFGIGFVIKDIANLLNCHRFVGWNVFSQYNCAITSLADLSLKNVVIAHRVLLFQILLGHNPVLWFILIILIELFFVIQVLRQLILLNRHRPGRLTRPLLVFLGVVLVH